jgi:L-alanine-DL-glutamate epimerase-like enolase superfamily enzyme
MLAANGKVTVPTGPGLGVEPDMAVVEKYRHGSVGVIN